MITDIFGSEFNKPFYSNVALVMLALLVSLSITQALRFSPDSMHYLDISTTLAQERHYATYHLNLNST